MAQAPSECTSMPFMNGLHRNASRGMDSPKHSAPEAHIAPTTLKAYADMRDVPSKLGRRASVCT